jgi:hypothetical protein
MTLTVTTTSTPIEQHTKTETGWITSAAKPHTTTVPNQPYHTLTLTPLPIFKFTNKGIFTITKTSLIPTVIATTTTTATACSQGGINIFGILEEPGLARVADVINDQIIITIGNIPQPRLLAPTTSTAAAPAPVSTAAPLPRLRSRHFARAQVIQVRQLVKRSPDAPTVTVVDASSRVTETATEVVATVTVTGTTTVVKTTTTTPVVTVNQGGGGWTTTWKAAVTRTKTVWLPVEVVSTTKVQSVTATVTEAACET